MDIPAMRANFDKAAATGDEAPLYFYSHLFLSHPETRQLFPVSMAHQRDRLFAALGDVVARVDDLDALVPILQQLGRDHRKFGTVAPENTYTLLTLSCEAGMVKSGTPSPVMSPSRM